MPKRFTKKPILADSYQVPRYKYSEKDEEYYDTPDEYGTYKRDWSPVYRTRTNTIEVPDNINNPRDRKIHMVIQDEDGHEILKNGWYATNVIDDIYRYLPHWGFDIVKNIASDPNQLIVKKNTDDYVTVKTTSYPKKGVHADSDMFGIDDAFFTKEELIEFSNAVEDDVNDKFASFNSPFSIKCTGIWLEDDNRTITMDYICFPNENEYSTSVRIDYRQIKAPRDIFKYVEKMADKINQEIQDTEVTGSCDIGCSDDYVGNLLPFSDEDGYYCVTAYYDDSYRGRADDFASNSFDDIILKCNEYCNSGFYVEVENMGSGEGKRYTPDEWLECIDQTGEPPYSVFNLSDGNVEEATDISCSSNIDALERIAHDTFNDVLSGRGRDQVTDDIILEAALKYDPNLSEEDKDKVIDLTNEQIDSYFNIGSFGQVQAEKYGDKILQAYEGKTISKRKDKANDPGGLTYCANAIGLGTFQLLEALEGMCADGRAREIDDSTYYVGQ